MSLWWLQEGWTEIPCAQCGSAIWPEGDPDWGLCFTCFGAHLHEQRESERHDAEMNAQWEREQDARSQSAAHEREGMKNG